MKVHPIVPMLVVSALLLSACSSAAAATLEPTPLPTVIADATVIAEGQIIPQQSAKIGFGTGGQVAEVLAVEGDTVSAGQVIARLEGTAAMQASVQQAKEEVAQAQQALDDLNEPSLTAGADAYQQVAKAYDELREAEYRYDNYRIPEDQQAWTAAEGVAKTLEAVEAARAAFEPYKDKPESGQRSQLKSALSTARNDHIEAIRRFGLETGVAAARARLDQAEKDYADAQNAPKQEDVDAAQNRLETAKANLAAAQAAYADLELTAPFAGTIADFDLKVGEFVAVGTPVLTLADFSTWRVETKDLTELEVVKIRVGQGATIKLDALPGVEMTASVVSISPTFVYNQGDVTYTATLVLQSPDAQTRWGMTAVVTFDK